MERLLRRRWIVGALLLLVVVGAGYVLVPVGEPVISQATCDKVQLGWTPKQVQELAGQPTQEPLGRPTNVLLSYDGITEEWWNEDNAKIAVRYDRQTRLVKEKRYTPSDLSAFELLKRRIQRRIRALWR